ncbi:MAG: Hsp70 family protein [Chlamydiales bacterium]|nr:Hsp70 family protein [Chlamydiales bacterium]
MIVGIDLGTTNCVVHYFDTKLRLFQIEQYGCGKLPLLPSFCYLGEKTIVGQWAKEEGSKIPTRLVHSAKSWLSNPAADRGERILPLEADGRRLSPVEATTAYLMHIKEMWNKEHEDLEEQEVVLTVPASFDEVARTLTLEAARQAGLNPTLLEEPQAAFYAWIGKRELPVGSTVLVVDIGGGTTDFSLIDVVENGFRRMAVGKHLLLGGDNIDHALAHRLGCDNVHAVRAAKEKFFQTGEAVTFTVEGRGSAVVSGKSYTLSEEHLDLDGFFGLYNFEEAKKIQHKSGVKRVGLAFETEPSFTKQLAHFLWKSGGKPNYVLFNGGTLKPQLFRDRIYQSLQRWFGAVEVLESDDLDLAVSKGAVLFAQNKQIQAGSARGYYLGIDVQSEKKALTLIARGSDEGTWYSPDTLFTLRSNQPIAFELFSSNIRLDDAPGTLVPIDPEEMTPLPPIQTVLKLGKQKEAQVHLKVHFTAVGTLELFLQAQATDHKWKLDFDVRATPLQKVRIDETFEVGELDPAKAVVREAFAPGQSAMLKGVMKKLEEVLGEKKNNWSPSILRALFDSLLQQAEKRTLSAAYEARFWNLAGFFLRPGVSHPLDDHRIKELWKLHLFDKVLAEEVEVQKWICMRRIAAGLSKGQQLQLFNTLLPTIWKKKGLDAKKEYLYCEKLRCLASLELVNHDQKIKLGKGVLQRLDEGKGKPFDYWALGRLGARQPLYGTIANILPKEACEEWVHRLLAMPFTDSEHISFTLLHLARKTDAHEINLSETTLQAILEKHSLDFETPLTHEEQERFFGDALPSALILNQD